MRRGERVTPTLAVRLADLAKIVGAVEPIRVAGNHAEMISKPGLSGVPTR